MFDTFIMHRNKVVAWSTLISFYLMAPLAVAGAVILRRRRVPILPLVAFPVIVLISVITTFAQLRYRAPAEPAIVLLAAVSVLAIIRRFRAPKGDGSGDGDGVDDRPDGDGGEPSERPAMPVGAS
jgi:hypothetical protein